MTTDIYTAAEELRAVTKQAITDGPESMAMTAFRKLFGPQEAIHVLDRLAELERLAERRRLVLGGIEGTEPAGSCDWRCRREATGWREVLQSDIDKDPENWVAKAGEWLPVCSQHQPEYEQLEAALAAAEARATAAERDRDHFHSECDRLFETVSIHDAICDKETGGIGLTAKLIHVEDELAQARAALARYGRHADVCAALGQFDLSDMKTQGMLRENPRVCDCGLDAALVEQP